MLVRDRSGWGERQAEGRGEGLAAPTKRRVRGSGGCKGEQCKPGLHEGAGRTAVAPAAFPRLPVPLGLQRRRRAASHAAAPPTPARQEDFPSPRSAPPLTSCRSPAPLPPSLLKLVLKFTFPLQLPPPARLPPRPPPRQSPPLRCPRHRQPHVRGCRQPPAWSAGWEGRRSPAAPAATLGLDARRQAGGQAAGWERARAARLQPEAACRWHRRRHALPRRGTGGGGKKPSSASRTRNAGLVDPDDFGPFAFSCRRSAEPP